MKKYSQNSEEFNNSVNTLEQNMQKKKNDGFFANMAGGMVADLAATPVAVIGLGEGLFRGANNAVKAAFHDDYSMSDAITDTVSDNYFMNLSDKIDRNIRDAFNIPQYEDLTPTQQAANISGQLIPLIATGGSYGLIKLGKGLNKYATKAAKKYAISRGKALSPKTIKNLGITADLAENVLYPGVQITKGAPVKQKLAEGFLQTAIPFAVNEGIRVSSDQEGIFGDYRDGPDREISLLKDNRSLKRKTPLTDDDYLKVMINEKRYEDEQRNDALKTAGLIGGAMLGSVAATRAIRKSLQKDVAPITETFNENNFMQNLSEKTQFDMATADRFAFKGDSVDQGYLNPNTASELGQDFGGKVNNAYDSGKLGFGVEMEFAPSELYNELDGLKINNKQAFDELDECLNLATGLQNDAHFYNKNLDEGFTTLTTDDFLKDVVGVDSTFVDKNNKNTRKKNKLSLENSEYMLKNSKKVEKMAENYFKHRKLIQKLKQNPQTAKILEHISAIGKNMLEVLKRSGEITPEYAEYLLKNRTIDGVYIFKPIRKKADFSFWEKIKNFALRKQTKAIRHDENLQPRSSELFGDIRGYLDAFEDNIKGTLQDIEINVMKKKILDDFVENEVKIINTKHEIAIKKEEDWSNALFSKAVFGGNINLAREAKLARKDVIAEVNKRLAVKPLGKAKLVYDDVGEIEPMTLNKLLNKDFVYDNSFDNSVKNTIDDYKQHRKGDNIITYDYRGYRYYFEVDPVLAAALKFDTETLSIVGEALRDLKSFVQKTITGTLNPAFAIPSAIMSSHEGLALLNVIGNKLKVAPDDISRIEYLKEFKFAYDQIYTEGQLQNIMSRYSKIFGLMNKDIDPKFDKFLKDTNIQAVRDNINNLLLTDIKSLGGASARPYTTERGAYYNVSQLNIDTSAFDNIRKQLNNIYGYHGAKKVLNLLGNIQNAVRETPSIALTTYFGKKTGAIVDGKLVDPKKMQEVIDIIGTLTANVGKSGSGFGLVGNLAKLTENFVNYGNIMIKSLAPKIRASGISTGFDNMIQTIRDVYDPRVPFSDIMQNVQKHSADFVKNDFVHGLFISGMLPALAAYVWNNGSTKNREYYYAHSDHDKVSKLMFMNFFGEGRHLYMPMDQEVALASNIFTAMLDGIVGMSKYQENDPAFNQSKMIMKSLARSVGLDSVPALDILANMSGYEINLNMLDENGGINPLPRDKINADLSETAYENGVFSQKTHALLRSLFGNVGAIMLGIVEEGNVGADAGNMLSSSIQSVTDNLTKSARLLTNSRTISSFNETSKTVYEKQNLLDKIASVQNKNPKQAEIYETVKMFNRNRIKPIHDEIKAIRKDIASMKATNRLANGKVISYNEKKQTSNDLNRKLQKLFAQEYKEFNRLDNVLGQMYGNNITLKNFMQKTHGE